MKKGNLVLLLILSVLSIHAQVGYWEQSVIKDYESGVNLFDKELYSAASKKFSEVLSNVDDPTHEVYVGSEYYKAMCSVFLMNKDAEELVLEFVKNHPTSPRVLDAVWNTSEYMFNTRRYKNTIEWLERIDPNELDSDDKKAYYFRKGYSLFMKKDFKNASNEFYRIKDEEGKYASSAKYYYAHIAYADSNYITALENFKPLLDDPSFGAIVPYYLAQIYYKTGDMDALLEVGGQLINQSESKRIAEIAKLLGEAYFQKKNYEQAIVYFEMHRQKGGEVRTADKYTLGYSYYKLGRYDDAITAFNKIKDGNSQVVQNAYYHLGDCYIKTDRKNEAMSAFKAAMEVTKGDERILEDASFNYAKLNYELSNPYEDAIQALKRFLNDYPNSINKGDANKYLANLYITTKDYDNALKAISDAGLNTPEMKEAYQKVSYFRGVEFYNELKTDKAISLFSQSLKYPLNSTYVALAHYWNGESYYKIKEYDKAIDSYSQFQSTPGSNKLSEYSLSQYNKGYCYFMKEEYTSSATSFRIFLDGKSNSERLKDDASLRLGDSYFMIAKYNSAIQYYDRLTSTDRKDADYALFQKSLCQGLAGNNRSKIASLTSLLNKYPNSKHRTEARYEMASTYLKMDDNTNALANFKKFLADHPNSKYASRAWLNIGVIYRNMGDYASSIKTFKEIVDKYPASNEANEAISFAKLVYAQDNRINEYVEWVSTISFADIKRSSLDSTVYTTAFDYYSVSDCEKAIGGFKSYLEKFSDGLFVLKANYYLGDCLYRNEQDEEAEQVYKEVIGFPKSEYTELSLMRLASINYAAEDFNESILYYEQLASTAEDVNRLQDAYVGILRSAEKIADNKKVVQYAEIIMANDKYQPEIRNEAMLYRARSLWNMNETIKAYQAYTELKNKSQGAPKAEATYYVALLQNMEGEYEKSNETVFWMIENLPSYKFWRFKSLLILADNYWKLDDAFQANYTLEFVIDENYSDEIVAEAKALQEEIRRAEEQKSLEQEKLNEDLNQIDLDNDNDEDSENEESDENEEEEENEKNDENE